MAFSLFDLGQALNAGAGAVNNFRQQRALGDLGGKLQSGDYSGAAQTALASGDVYTGLNLLKLGQEQDKLRAQRDADAEVTKAIGGLGMTGGISAPAPAASTGGDIPRGLRNMNPGNIEAGSFTQSQPGYVGSDGRFAKFDTLEHGVGAQAALLDSYGRKGINTVAGIINRWAPQSENGAATGNYAQFVARKIGVDPNAPIDLSDPETRTRLAYAMGEFENGRPIGSGQTGQNIQVADASGAIPRSAGGGDAGNADALQQRLNVLSGLLAKPNLSASARAAIQAQIENTRNAISRSDRQTDLEYRRQERLDRRQERIDNRTAKQEEIALKRQERADQVEKQTGEQAKAAGFATRMAESNKVISDPSIFEAGLGVSGGVREMVKNLPGVGNALAGAGAQGPKFQQYDQAKRDFVNALLRQESGAAIGQNEFANAERQYFPAPGDSQEVIAQKAKNRATAIEGVGKGGNNTFRKEFEQKRASAPQGGPSVGAVEDGYRFKGGDPSKPESWERAQ